MRTGIGVALLSISVAASAQATEGPFGSHSISVLADGTRWVSAADVDGDGDVDVLSASINDDKIAWYENTDGAGSFGAQQVISTAADGPRSAIAADVDGDGDLDVLSGSYEDDEIAWYENTDGAGTFGGQQVISTAALGAYRIVAADMDGDRDVDVVSASYDDNKIAWYANNGAGSFGAQQVISTAASGALTVFAADLDRDGDLDVLSASNLDDKIAWYENDGTPGGLGDWQTHSISTAGDGANSVFAADVDGDGDMDVLSSSATDDEIAWYKNTDGAGTFGGQQVISTLADFAQSVFAADVDADGDVDVLSASSSDNKIAWYENVNREGTSWSQHDISLTTPAAWWVFAADLDGDADLDVLSASEANDEIAWYENQSVRSVACTGSSDAAIFALIDPLRVAASSIVIDGNDADWAAIPSFSDPADDLVGNPNQEIVAGAIAPLEDRVLLFARTAGAPPTSAGAFAVTLDLVGGAPADAMIILGGASGSHTVILFDEASQPLPPVAALANGRLDIAFGSDFLEVGIPYSLLESFLPGLAAPIQRSWARGGMNSWNGTSFLDQGPGATSYRLRPTPFPLDPLQPVPDLAALVLDMPLRGQSFILQGPFGAFSHSRDEFTPWAYDFSRVDGSFNRSSPPNSTNNSDYFGFGNKVLAPANGTVTQVVENKPDQTPGITGSEANLVNLDVGDDVVSLLHFKQNSVVVDPSDVVAAGQHIADLGNSGWTIEPHLHVEVAPERPIALSGVRVSLNPVPNDPWTRECTTWEPREGFLVVARIIVPAMGPYGHGAVLALVLGTAYAILRRRPTGGS